MENASKALIIAGAILLSILIIGLGMYIYSQASGAMSGTNLDSQKISAYNGEFEAYFGDNVNGSNVRSLVNLVNTHNRANTSDMSLQIGISDQDIAAFPTTAYAAFSASSYSAGKSYTVKGTYDAKSGYLMGITIKVN